MEPMPPLEGAVRPAVDPTPDPAPKHPRLAALGSLMFPAVMTLFWVGSLQRDGFGWVAVIGLILSASLAGARIQAFRARPGAQDHDGQGVPEPS